MIQGLNHVTLEVDDLDRALEFYSALPGARPVLRSPNSLYVLVGDLWLALTRGERRDDHRYDHLALSVKAEDFDACVATLGGLDARVWQPNSSEGRSFYFEDPAGNRWELHCGGLAERVRARRGQQGVIAFPAAELLAAPEASAEQRSGRSSETEETDPGEIAERRPMAGRYIEKQDGVTRIWQVERLWKLSEDLPVESVPIETISALDEVTWFNPEQRPTAREVVSHCRRINGADLGYPILLSADGKVFDGMHRIGRALLEGRDSIEARRFPQNPEPDEVHGAPGQPELELVRRLEWELNADQHAAITALRNACFPDHAVPRSWFKQRPQLRWLAGRGRELLAHMGVEHRMISIAGEPLQIFGVVDLCVAEAERGQGLAGRLLKALEAYARDCGIDALVLMADDPQLYRRHGYELRPGLASWLRISEHKSYGVAVESLQDLMIKPLNGELPKEIFEGHVDFLGHLF